MKHLEEIIKLLNHIHEKPEATQRELVEKLDVSLGKVNFIIRALAEKGLIKLRKFKNSRNKKGYLYVLTPLGMQEKASITRRFFEEKVIEYERIKKEIETLKTIIDAEDASKNRQ